MCFGFVGFFFVFVCVDKMMIKPNSFFLSETDILTRTVEEEDMLAGIYATLCYILFKHSAIGDERGFLWLGSSWRVPAHSKGNSTQLKSPGTRRCESVQRREADGQLVQRKVCFVFSW